MSRRQWLVIFSWVLDWFSSYGTEIYKIFRMNKIFRTNRIHLVNPENLVNLRPKVLTLALSTTPYPPAPARSSYSPPQTRPRNPTWSNQSHVSPAPRAYRAPTPRDLPNAQLS